MKRLLCAGYPDIYEIARVFRDGEAGPRHQPEFTLVEWYRRGFNLDQMMHETVAMLTRLIEPSRLGGPPHYRSYADAFRDSVGIDPLSAEVHALRRSADVDARLEEALGDRRDAWLDLLLATRVAPSFAVDRLTVLHRYPASQAALARLNPDDPSVADRFEAFHGAVELANGFVELTDAPEQTKRFATDQAQRQSLGKSTAPIDDRFLAALQAGLPDCAGVAIGFDRVLMINEAAADIRAVMTFPFEAS
jgi:lysyl-tRNA synthetase class 2